MFNFKKNIGKQLKSQAESLGACEKGLNGLEKLNEQELINRYIHFIDFIVEKDLRPNFWRYNLMIKSQGVPMKESLPYVATETGLNFDNANTLFPV